MSATKSSNMEHTTPVVTAHVRRDEARVSFQHLRCTGNEAAHRAAIVAAADFIFPYSQCATRTKRRPRSAVDYRDSSPSLTSLITSSSSNDSTSSASSKTTSRARRLRERLRFSTPSSIRTSSAISHNAHTFAITHPDGSRLYCFVKLLSTRDALLIIANAPLVSFYTDVLERTAAVFFDTQPMLREYNTPASVVAACCVRSLHDKATSDWLTAYAHSLSSLPNVSPIDESTDEDRTSFDSCACPITSIAPAIAATLHTLSDSSAVSTIPPRMLSCVLAALMDERRVAVVGSSVPTVSRVVLALSAMLTPFEWPHLLSPILPKKHAAVLETPFPYLVGVDKKTLDDVRCSALDGVLLVHLDETKLEPIGDEFVSLFRAIPRMPRARLERRLLRARHTSNMGSYNAVVQRALENFFADVLDGTDCDVARRHRSFVARKGVRATRTGSWTPAFDTRSEESLVDRFKRTQMYMAWADEKEDKYAEHCCVADTGALSEDEDVCDGGGMWTNWGFRSASLFRQSVTVRI